MESYLPLPARRDRKSLTEWVTGLSVADAVSVVIADDRHGPYRLDGSLAPGLVQTELMLAGVEIRSSKSAPGSSVRAIPTVGVPDVNEIGVFDLEHGDLVTATFEQSPYGVFRITGYVTASEHDSLLLVGGWILTASHGIAPRLLSVGLLDAVETIPPPGKRTVLAPA